MKKDYKKAKPYHALAAFPRGQHGIWYEGFGGEGEGKFL